MLSQHEPTWACLEESLGLQAVLVDPSLVLVGGALEYKVVD